MLIGLIQIMLRTNLSRDHNVLKKPNFFIFSLLHLVPFSCLTNRNRLQMLTKIINLKSSFLKKIANSRSRKP